MERAGEPDMKKREWMWDHLAWWCMCRFGLGYRCVIYMLDYSKRDLTCMNARGKIPSPRMH